MFYIKNILINIAKGLGFYFALKKLQLSAILYLTENGPGTIFNDFKKTIYEKVGKIVFFSSEAWHEVKPFKSKEARYTLALNFKSF